MVPGVGHFAAFVQRYSGEGRPAASPISLAGWLRRAG